MSILPMRFSAAIFCLFFPKKQKLVRCSQQKSCAYLGLRGMCEGEDEREEGVSGRARALTCVWERVREKDEHKVNWIPRTPRYVRRGDEREEGARDRARTLTCVWERVWEKDE